MLRIYLLGSLRLVYNDAPLKFTVLPKVPQLLAYLLLAEASPLPRAAAAYLLWPDVPEAEARSNLRRHLHDLRRALPPEPDGQPWLHAETSTLEWNRQAPYWLDVENFIAASGDPARLTEAVDLYKGDLLETVYDDWIFFPRETLRTKFLDCLVGLTQQSRLLGDYTRAIAAAQRLLQYDPLREDIVRELMTLRQESGDRAGALSEYQQFERRLRTELGVPPMAETQALYDTIARRRNGTPALRNGISAPPPRAGIVGCHDAPAAHQPTCARDHLHRPRG